MTSLERFCGIARRPIIVSKFQTIFVLLENTTDGKHAVLICDKNPFAEDASSIDEWIAGSSLKHIVDNDVYGSYELFLPEKFNG